MKDNQSQTESLLDIVKGIESQSIMLPEFQRDFRWELEQTYDLFDSLIRDIFIGTLIYGKPSFGMTLREIDTRPRKGKGSNGRLKTYDFTTQEIVQKTQTQNLKVVLDGQQRITSLYRAIVGKDTVYLILRDGLDDRAINTRSLEEIFLEISGQESPSAISVKLSDAYEAEVGILEEDEDFNQRFAQTLYARRQLSEDDEETRAKRKEAEKIYRRAIRKLADLYKQQKMVAYYLLDMSLDKFCIFFERSNSRAIQLDFTDILAAKLYHGFNLRRKIEDFESQSKVKLNREVIVRAIAYICGVERSAISIDKKTILEQLDADDFNKHWDKTCQLYTESLNYLIGQNFVLSQDWIPSENMVIPLMMFRRQIKGFDQVNEEQRKFIEFWYWASIFANRYSTSSNEVIIADSNVLTQIAKDERVSVRGYFNRMRSLVAEPEDLFSYSKRSSAIYKGILNLLGYASQGLMDWGSAQRINVSMRLEDHHIFPRAYIASNPTLDIDQNEAEQLVDCVVNRTLIPKLLNIQVGKKSPQTYLSELQQKSNSSLATCLPSHLIPAEIISDPERDSFFLSFLEDRAQAIFALIERYAVAPAPDIIAQYGSSQTDDTLVSPNIGKLRFKDMIALGRICVGDRIFIRQHPDQVAKIVDGNMVEFEGQQMPINTWGQKITGWSSINIYDQVILERTGQLLESLRGEL